MIQRNKIGKILAFCLCFYHKYIVQDWSSIKCKRKVVLLTQNRSLIPKMNIYEYAMMGGGGADYRVLHTMLIYCVSTFPQDFRVITGLDFTMWTLTVAGSFTGMTAGLSFLRTGVVGILLEMSRTIPQHRDVFESSMENGEQLNAILRDDLYARHRKVFPAFHKVPAAENIFF